jgi:hypothetical protein
VTGPTADLSALDMTDARPLDEAPVLAPGAYAVLTADISAYQQPGVFHYYLTPSLTYLRPASSASASEAFRLPTVESNAADSDAGAEILAALLFPQWLASHP